MTPPFERHRLKLWSSRLVRVFAPDPLLAALRFGWVTLIIWGEIGVFFYALSGCRWPGKMTMYNNNANVVGTGPTRILMVADAQVPMPHVHSQTFLGLFHDIYMRRAWHATRRLHPHLVLFLGDMLKTGRSVDSDEEFTAYVQHFKSFFPLDLGVDTRYIPGNADVGLGVSSAFSKHVRQRYEHHFGRVNQHLTKANHSLILLDSPGIVDEDYIRAGHGTSFEEWIPLRDGAIEFVKGLAAEEEQLGPAILFSHIPLHRAESRQCGPFRERGTIHRGVGHGWQKTLGKQTSSFLLEICVHNADDRDYCDVTHKVPGTDKEIHEITVKSFSPARHITQPGFHLLSLQPGLTPSHAHAPCLLPPASGTSVRLYIPATFLTILILIIAHMQRGRRAARLRLTTVTSPLPSHTEFTGQQQLGSRHQLQPPQLHPPVPSPYSASSAYSYSYAYTNTPPSSQQGRGRTRIELPKRDSRHTLVSGIPDHTAGGGSRPHMPRSLSPPLALAAESSLPQTHDEDDHDGVRAHYLYMPRASSPLPGDLIARRHSGRATSPVATATGPPARAWSYTYTFTFRGRRRRIAVHAPAWWPRRTASRRKENRIGNAVARDLGRALTPALVTWVALTWWYSG
ncbi:hypothetical protein B0F90DRAFT_1822136 [Multifurca ochricompacta]|uniref:Calcineurin-like phosphoesterase domain-containing protein n=1 Tax=Multifurca ochricompacta TaxID=376703 RepID=A0AAD4QK59_9AGAM|nr:hypothetical protein B0F90DRAFT_1822136 [Multifurca ochricompacta]